MQVVGSKLVDHRRRTLLNRPEMTPVKVWVPTHCIQILLMANLLSLLITDNWLFSPKAICRPNHISWDSSWHRSNFVCDGGDSHHHFFTCNLNFFTHCFFAEKDSRRPQVLQYYRKHIAVLVFQCLAGQAPSYLSDDCQPVSDSRPRRLRSSDSLTCVVRRAHNTYGDRCFATAGPRVRNSLPAELQGCDSLRQFKRCLKTFLIASWDYGALWLSVK